MALIISGHGVERRAASVGPHSRPRSQAVGIWFDNVALGVARLVKSRGMRGKAESTITVDLITSNTDLGELTKLVVKFGMEVDISRVDDDEMGPHIKLVAHRSEAEWMETEIVDMILLHAFSNELSVNQIMESVNREISARHAPLDSPSKT